MVRGSRKDKQNKDGEQTKGVPPPAKPSSDGEDSDEDMFPGEEEGGIRVGDIYIPPAPPAVCSVESTGPRLIITKIEAENFKSYAGKQALGPFHKSFTSIIGPNGSGKSNVIDSMLFVFGYRASKIRSKKIGVLLHKSPNHQNIRSCTVAVSFCQIIDKPNDEFDEIPNSHFVISRTAFPDNSSYYTLNGKRVQFKEVAAKLREHGIDLVHNRFLILQGEVEQIAMMKPKGPSEHESGMLEYLEDIIGTSRFKVPIEKLAAKVEELTQERLEKVTRVKLAEKERDSMEGPMRDAVDFLKSENELTHNRNKLFQKKILIAEKKMALKEEEKKKVDDGMSQLKEELKKFQEERQAKETEVETLKSELEKMHKQKEELNLQFNKTNRNSTSMSEEISQTNVKRKKLMEQKKQEEHKLNELKNVPEKNRKDIKELEKLQEKLQVEQTKEEAEVSKVLASLQKETAGLQDDKDKQEAELSGLKNAVTDAKSEYDITQSKLNLYLKNEQAEKARLEQLKTTFANITSIHEKRRQEVDDLNTKLPEMKVELLNSETELAQLRSKEKSLAQKLQRERVALVETRSSMQANQSKDRVLNYLMRKKQSGELPGIFGRLGDLGAIDAKYDVAVSTACGPLDNIVVDTAEMGKLCIEALRRDNVGRGTFIALDKQEHLRSKCSEPMHTPENVPRLFDLIKVADDRVLPAFYYALRNTLVANNLEQASRIAYGQMRHRVVTLEGEIIEPSGTMAGGGKRKLRGRMGRTVATVTTESSMSAEEMQRKEEELREQEECLADMRQRIVALEKNTFQLRSDIESCTKNVKRFNTELQSLEKQLPDVTQQLEAQEAKVKAAKPDPATVKDMEKTVAAAKKELDKAQSVASVVETKVMELHKKIMEATGGRMKAAQKKLEEVNRKLDKIRTDLSRLTVGIKTAERNSKKSAEKIVNLTSEIEEAEKQVREMANNMKGLEEEGAKLLKMIESISEGIKEKEDTKKDLVKSTVGMSKEENRLKATKLVEDQKIESIAAEIKEQRDKIPHYKNGVKKLKLHKIPNEPEPEVLETLNEEQLDDINVDRLSFKVTNMEENLSKKKPNLTVIDEYFKKVEQYEAKAKELDEVTAKRNECRDWHDSARKSRLGEFLSGFQIITHKLKELYQMITLGGDAELELVDSLDPFSDGIVFSVRPPKKSWKNISNLSGGEKTLSSLALVFALHYYKPTPLYVMDEIDAALDFKNVSIVGHYIKERTKNAQFIIISLRANMFELADRLVGIYKTHNCTKSATLNPGIYCKPPYVPEGYVPPPLVDPNLLNDSNASILDTTTTTVQTDAPEAAASASASAPENEAHNSDEKKATKNKSLLPTEEDETRSDQELADPPKKMRKMRDD